MLISQLQQMRDNGSDEPLQIEAVRILEFRTDKEAHDEALQFKAYEDMEAEFDNAVAEGVEAWGAEIDIANASDDWLEEFPVDYDKLAAWSDGTRISFLALSHEDRECPIIIYAGVLLLDG